MGSSVKKVVKKVKKIVPKEVKPILPAVAAIYGPAALAKTSFGTASGFASLAPGVQSAIVNAATQAATEGKIDPREAAISGITAQLGAKAKLPKGPVDTGGLPTETILSTSSKTLQPVATATQAAKAAEIATKQTPVLQRALSSLAPVDLKETIANEGIMTALKQGARAAAPAATYSVSSDLKELNEQMIRDYEAQLAEQGILQKDDRRNQIFGYFSRAGYDDDEINSMLDKYGYADGGRVGYNQGGNVTISREEYDRLLEAAMDDDNDFDLGSLQAGIGGLETAFGRSFMDQPKPMGITPGFGNMPRIGRAEGGIMNVSDLNNDRFLEQRAEEYMEQGFSPDEAMDKALDDLKNNRFPALKDGGMMNLGGREMDMRGGGFIPIGKKERADDVPARLSKNEFVMTADAVRAAGDGSINKGAKRMYDLMNKLESKV